MKYRVLVLTHQAFQPPDSLEGLSDQDMAPWKTEYDVVTALEHLGHPYRILGGVEELGDIRRTLHEWKPRAVVNLLEEFQGRGVYVPFVLGYLQLLGVPYTGCNPAGLTLADDKVLTKKILRYHRIPSPEFQRFRVGRVVRPRRRLTYPLIVKSATEHGSAGIAQASVVTSRDKLIDRIAWVHEHLQTDAIVEEYVEGRELYVGVLGNRRLVTLPPWEMEFRNLPEGAPRIATARVKWNVAYQNRAGIRTRRATGLSDQMGARLSRVCRRVYRILGLSGYARMDFRLTGDGRLYLLEPNPNPDLALDEDFAESARAAGLEYEPLIARILNLGRRYQRTIP